MQNVALLETPETDIPETAAERTASLPWYVVAMAVGATSVVVGVIWDISWHRTIGRDTFWTPAHMAIYLGGLIAGLGGGWLILTTTFGRGVRTSAVRFWGLRAPLGAWVAVWGACAMLTSAPFDDWWHNAYGLDVKVISPPHMVLALGFMAINVAAMLLALAQQNRGEEGGSTARTMAFAYVAGMLLAVFVTLITEYIRPNHQHGARFYLVCCALLPPVLVAAARASRLRWPATTVASVYMGLYMLMIWILPLFPAQPLLAPIYNPVDHMVPPSFPLLLVVPALAVDVLMRRVAAGGDTRLAVLLGTVFFGLFFSVQWLFSDFLMSPGAENWFFASHLNWGYGSRPGPWQLEYWGDMIGWRGVLGAFVLALVTSRLGLAWGGWMRRVVR